MTIASILASMRSDSRSTIGLENCQSMMESQKQMQAKRFNKHHHNPAERQLHHSVSVPDKDGWRRCASRWAECCIGKVPDAAHWVAK